MLDYDQLAAALLRQGLVDQLAAALPRLAGASAESIRPISRLSKSELATSLRRTTATIDRWVAAGMPCDDMGTYKLFDLDACRAWAASRPKVGRPPKRASSSGPAEHPVAELRSRRRVA